ncbi:uncharacterized protein PAC_04168 [Phialocephala subalpina]|uniref:Uncharacterized protein n=1 Tax=Phialocephala subalpina TaxID=576137 RepID=A0A1L7WND7_9HELO|nr:uncharacterized protein PAC_04168 [Phialocephala subalpina]
MGASLTAMESRRLRTSTEVAEARSFPQYELQAVREWLHDPRTRSRETWGKILASSGVKCKNGKRLEEAIQKVTGLKQRKMMELYRDSCNELGLLHL